MGTLSVRIPDSLHNEVKKLSKSDNVSINQFIASALSEKITALEAEAYITQRAKLGEKSKFLDVLSKVPSNEPLAEDK